MSTSTPERELRFFPGYEQPGETVLLPSDIFSLITKFEQMSIDAGTQNIRVSKLLSTPILAERPTHPTPAFLRHPFMWLPDRLYAPVVHDGEAEELEHWVLRVGLEILMSGLYSEEYGWVDCLSIMGLDLEHDEERLVKWINGEKDDVLDSFSLEEHLDIANDIWWSFDKASDMLAGLNEVAIANVARFLSTTVKEIIDDDGEIFENNLQRAQSIAMCMEMAGAFLPELDLDFASMQSAVMNDDDVRDDDSVAHEFATLMDETVAEFENVEESYVDEYEQIMASSS